MNVINLIPGARVAEAWVIGTVMALVAGALFMQHEQNVKLKLKLTNSIEGRQADREAMAAAARLAIAQNKADTAAMTVQQKENADESQRIETRARTAAVAAAVSDLGVRHAFAAAAAGRCAASGSAAAASGIDSAPAAGVVLSDVFGRADGRAGELAAALDQSHARGLACERSDAIGR